MTDEQKQRRAETARANGRKSKGPVTQAGKYRSSMNAISTGEHTQLHQNDLPSFFPLLSTDNRANYIRLFQDHLRRHQPTCDFERGLLQRMTIELFLFDRQTELATKAAQEDMDWVRDYYSETDPAAVFLQGHQRLCKQRDLLRMIDRNRRAHLSAFQNFMKLFVQSRNQKCALPEPLPEVAAPTEIEPGAASSAKPNKALQNNDLTQTAASLRRAAIAPNQGVQVPPHTTFHMENEGAARKPGPPRSVTL